jgi:putative FmdB family regulatory protein
LPSEYFAYGIGAAEELVFQVRRRIGRRRGVALATSAAGRPGGEDYPMPLYEYQCTQCSERREILQKFSDPPLSHCPKCGGDMKKLQSSPAIQFKGSGFYKTDYASATSKGEGSSRSESGSKGESSSGSEASSKGESSKGDSSSKGESAKSESSKGESSSKSESSKSESSKSESSKSESSKGESSSRSASSSAPSETRSDRKSSD